ncbi:MAG: hypothetical protein MUP81_05425 [Dehalococcoidia bacterium]|nr:hypothetical protein [Dehalococcoidia bacterium]
MLTGEAKKNYQRDYMRKRRANKAIRPMSEVRPDLKPLDLLDQTLGDCRSGLAAINNNLEEMKKTLTGNPPEPEIIADTESVCPVCGGKGYRELDKAGLIRVPCEECKK